MHSKITSDFDDCEFDIDDRCERFQEHFVQKDAQNFFLDFVYDTSIEIISKQYMTSFA